MTEVSGARCFRIHHRDNVGTMLEDAPVGEVSVLGGSGESSVRTTEPIRLGHKVALQDIRSGEPIIKYGVPVGEASRPISRGSWVHLHNCSSLFDERSRTFDPYTGATTDTKYE